MTTTKDGLHVYDLDPNASELWAVAGPEGYDVKAIDPDNLPAGFRWVEAAEWEQLQKQAATESPAAQMPTTQVIRFSKDASISIVWDTATDEAIRCPTQHDMDTLPVGEDLTDEEIDAIED